MPWFTRGCCEWITSLNLYGKKIFEYGGGQSSLWFKSQGCIVYGVDHQKEWADLGGIDWQTDESTYVKSIIKTHEVFDIVCIDGEWRDKCTEYALNRLAEEGFIIIDNFEQGSCDLMEWPNTNALIDKCGLKVKRYYEPLHPDWQTIVITR